jgi:hypothetical protein
MKKILIASLLIGSLVACTKESAPIVKTSTNYFIQVEAVDNDNITTTESKIAIVKVIQ